jgi:Ca-activated chloride channel family protein
MSGLTFAQPAWFWGGLVLLPLLALRLHAHFRSARQLPGLVSPRLSRRLINGANQGRRWTVFLLQCLALLCLVTALARPQWGFEEVEVEIDARNLLIAIDTSRSMMSDDLPPNRLERAKLAAKDIILSLPDDRIGLIAFAGKAFLQAPLTVDHEAVLESIDQLDTEIIPRGGTNLSAAVTLALETVKEAKIGPSALILFSDGEALEGVGEVERVRNEAAKAGLTILSIGVGTPEGSIIPEVDDAGKRIPGVFVKDENGQVVRTRLTPEPLQALATRNGSYLHLGGSASLTRVVEQIRESLASSREEGEKARKPLERFVWPLSAAFVLFVLSHLVPLFWLKPLPARQAAARPRRAAAALAVFLAVPSGLDAADPLQPGLEAYARQDYAGALSAYESVLGDSLSARAQNRVQMGLGAAAYRLGNFERAAEAYGTVLANGDERLRGEAHYNLGNTLFRRGEAALMPAPDSPRDPDQPQAVSAASDAIERTKADWNGAVEHFESSLALDPDNARIRHNLDYVKKRLEELKQQEEQQQQQQEQQQQNQEKQPQDSPGDEKKKEEQKPQDGKDKPKEGKQDPKEDQSNDSPQPQDGKNEPKDPNDSQSPGSKDPQSGPEEGNPDKPPKDEPGESDKPEDDGKPGSPKDSGETPPDEPEQPQDGKLEANPNQSQPDRGPEGRPGQTGASESRPNPLTGYSPTEARQLLDALADETEVRPVLQPARGEKFKNW